MKQIWAQQALLPEGWARDVLVSVADDGTIAEVASGQPAAGDRVGILLPAPVNVHSHAFQRAMAGMTERRGPDPRDSFWTWRRLMFRFLDQLTPDHIEAITAFVQMEMLQAGYATNAEFHYIHHQPGGVPYDNLAELSVRVAAAAGRTGIGLTLLPVQYQFGGCDGRALGPGQIRFGCDPDQFLRLHEGAREALRALPADAAIGVAPHSLRAVGVETLGEIHKRHPDGPIHMHLAEQKPEVEEVRAHWGARPVEWALDNMEIDSRWCLIHCTQMTTDETRRLAGTGGVAGLCPITESSLGDGIFNGVEWLEAGGAISVGSDSNIRISLSEELRTLEYSQRLRDGSRAATATEAKSTGRRLYDDILRGGVQATGRNSGAIAVGRLADLTALDATAVDLEGTRGDGALDAWIFAGDDRLVREVWSAGRHVVQDGAHVDAARITESYRRAMADLRGVI